MDKDEELETFLRARALFHSLSPAHQQVAVAAMEYMYERCQQESPFL